MLIWAGTYHHAFNKRSQAQENHGFVPCSTRQTVTPDNALTKRTNTARFEQFPSVVVSVPTILHEDPDRGRNGFDGVRCGSCCKPRMYVTSLITVHRY